MTIEHERDEQHVDQQDLGQNVVSPEPVRRPSTLSTSVDATEKAPGLEPDKISDFHSLEDNGSQTDLELSALRSGSDDAPDGGRQAWLVVLSGFICYFVAYGQQNAFGVYQTYYLNEWPDGPLATASQISWVGSVQVFVTFLSSFLTGLLMDRIGPKRILLVGTILFTASCELLSISHVYWAVFLSQGLLQGLSIGILFTPALVCTSQYFSSRRGLALGIVAAGSSAGGICWPIALDQLIHHGPGFQWGLRIIGFISLGLLCLAIPFMNKRVANLRIEPLIDATAFRNRGFMLLLVGNAVLFLGYYFEYYFEAALGAIHGMPTEAVFYLASASSGSSLVGRIIAGFLGDHLGRFNVLLLATTLSGVIVYATIAATPLYGHSITGPLFAIAAAYGLVSGAFFALQVAVVVSFCPDPRRLGTRIGMLYMAVSIPGLVGAPLGALLFQRYDFPAALAFAGSAIMVGAALMAASRMTLQPALRRKV